MGRQTLQKEQQDMISVMTQALPYLRRELHISQTDLAEKVGVSRQTISLIERGEQNMTWTLFLAIAFFFKSNNDFVSGKRAIYKKYPSVVEQILLLKDRMNRKAE